MGVTMGAESLNTESVVSRDAEQLCAISYMLARVHNVSEEPGSSQPPKLLLPEHQIMYQTGWHGLMGLVIGMDMDMTLGMNRSMFKGFDLDLGKGSGIRMDSGMGKCTSIHVRMGSGIDICSGRNLKCTSMSHLPIELVIVLNNHNFILCLLHPTKSKFWLHQCQQYTCFWRASELILDGSVAFMKHSRQPALDHNQACNGGNRNKHVWYFEITILIL